MCWHGSASGKRGRRPKYSEAAIQFCLTIKGLFNLALRQAMGMAQSLLKLAGLGWQVPDFSTVSRRQKHLSVTIGVRLTTTGGSVALLIKRWNFHVRALTRSNWADHSCQRRKLVGGRHCIGAVDRELALADHVDQFNAGEHGSGCAE
jgi:hypothetical protein